MKRKVAMIVLTLVCSLVLAAGLTACGDRYVDPPAHTHAYTWTDNGDGTHDGHCGVSGCATPDIKGEAHVWGADNTCSKCGAVNPSGENHTHAYKQKYDETEHWMQCDEVGCPQKTKDRAKHDTAGSDGACSVCGYKAGVTSVHKHAWSDVWESDDAHHWHDCTAQDCPVTEKAQKDGYGAHTFVDGVCVCGKKRFTVTFDSRGGNEVPPSEVFEGKAVSRPDDPVRENYRFLGWYKDAATWDSIWDFASDKVTENITLYAKWLNTSTEIQSVEGATVSGNSIFMRVSGDMERVALADKVTTTQGSIWRLYRDELGMNEIPTKIAVGEAGTLEYGNNVLYIIVTSADATQINVYELTVHRSKQAVITYIGGDGETVWKTETKTSGYTYPVEYTPTAEGYVFHSWRDAEGNETTSLFLLDDTTLYADCTANTYTVSLDVNGGNALSESSLVISYGSNYTLPTPEKTGHTFGGWYYTADDAQTQMPSDGKWQVASDTQLTAKWTINTYTLTVLTDGDSDKGTATGGGKKEYASEVTLTATVDVGYVFVGWFNGDEQLSDELQYTFSMPAQSVTYTARWTVDPELAPFNFTADENGITITGVKDKGVTSITVPSSVTSITQGAFSGCTSLTSITIPFVGASKDGTENTHFGYLFGAYNSSNQWNSVPSSLKTVVVTGGKSIANRAFYKCGRLTSITIPDSVTYIGSEALIGCDKLESITIPFVGGARNTHFGYLFGASSYSNQLNYVPNSLRTVVITGGTFIGANAFYLCSYLTSITLPDSVTRIGDSAFEDCYSLTSIKLPDGVTNIAESVFSGCGSLTSIKLPDGVTSIGDSAFQGCSGLTSITIPDNVTSIGAQAFYNCRSLTSITLPDGVTSIGDHTFHDCSSLTSITLPDSVTSIGEYAFSGCTGLTGITLPDGVTSIGSYVFDGCTGLTSITLPGGVTSIANYMFSGCTGLTGITLPDSVESIGRSAFSGCTGFTSVTIPNKVTSIGEYAFFGCTGLTSITLPFVGASKDGTSNTHFGYIFGANRYSNNSDYVPSLLKTVIVTGGTSIGSSAFEGCSGLTSITLPDSVTSIGDGAFYDCGGLSSFAIPEKVTSIDKETFHGCTGLTSMVIPARVTSVGDHAFSGCTGLASITISDGVESIADNAFYGCRGLTSITIPDSVASIGSDAFRECSSLESITLPFVGASKDGAGSTLFTYIFGSLPSSLKTVVITGGTNIGSSAFEGCSGVTSITLPDSLTSIGDKAFSGCVGLTNIAIPGGVESIGSSAFSGCTGLASIIVNESNALYSSQDGILYNKAKTQIVHVPQAVKGAITMPDGVESVGESAFSGCIGLTGITLPDSVASIGKGAFSGCSSLESITLPFVGASNDGTSNTHFGYIFGASSYSYNKNYVPASLKTVVITGGTRIGVQAFYNCSSLTSITLPDSVERVGNGAFSGCGSLTYNTYDNAKYLGNAIKPYIVLVQTTSEDITSCTVHKDTKVICADVFSGCDGLAAITVHEDNPSYASQDGILYDKAKTQIVHVPKAIAGAVTIPDSVESIGKGAFSGCSSLESITLPFVGASKDGTSNTHFGYIFGANYSSSNASYVPASLKTVVITGGTSIGSSAFSDCSGLTSITIPDSVTSIGSYAFSGCSSLESITLPFVGASKDGTSNKNLMYIFGNSVPTSLKTVVITGGTSIGYEAFEECGHLTSITLPDSLTDIGGYAFRNCTGLTSITISSSVIRIDAYAFSGCSRLTIYSKAASKPSGWHKDWNPSGCPVVWGCVESGMTQDGVQWGILQSDTAVIAGYCGNGTEIVIPSEIQGKSVTRIESYAFSGSVNLTSVTIPDSVESIGSYAFRNCYALTEIVIPSSVQTIGEYAFAGSSLTVAVFEGDVGSVDKNAFKNCYALWDLYYLTGNDANIQTCFGNMWDGQFIYPDRSEQCGGSGYFRQMHKVTVHTDVTEYVPAGNVTITADGFIFANGYLIGYTGKRSGELVLPESFEGHTYTVSEFAFYGHSYSKIVVSGGATSIGTLAFGTDSSASNVEVVLEDGVTSIGNGAFNGVRGLRRLVISSSVTYISDRAFGACTSLTDVTYNGTTAEWKDLGKGVDSGGGWTWDYDAGDYTVTCTDGKLDKDGNEITA